MTQAAVRWAVCLLLFASWNADAADAVQFNRDIRTILADKCYACHGPDAKEVQADLRLDLRDTAVASGAIVPNRPEASELVRRIFSADENEVMPPPDSQKALTPREKQLLKQWVAEGAEYQDHWAFVPPVKAPLPPVKQTEWIRNEIDRFVLSRLESQGMRPSSGASRETLIRRVSLDLRGFPPSLEEIDAYLADSEPGAYGRMVDRMLASPHFGEKMTALWMDLARYGDTNGYHYDSTRQVWLWRDWVLDAYNTNMPFDQFTIQQLAGDLLPDATVDQKIASGFNRNTRYNEEGGADPAEWLVRYAVDRTITLGQVWMGMTLQCAECHSHKYDPISHQEFYQLYAFFNSLNEPGAQGHRGTYPPLLKVPSEEQERQLAELKARIAELESRIQTELAKVDYREPADVAAAPEPKAVDVVWIDDAPPAGAALAGDGAQPWQWVERADHPVHAGQRATRREATGLSQHYFTGAQPPLEISEGDVLFAHVWLDPQNPPKTVQLQFNDGSWEHRAYWGENRAHGGGSERPGNHRVGDLPHLGKWVRLEVPAADVGLKPGSKINGWAFTQVDGLVYYDTAGITQTEPDVRHLRSLAVWEQKAAQDKQVPDNVRKAIAAAPDQRNSQQQQLVRDYYIEHVFGGTRDVFDPLHRDLTAARDNLKQTEEAVPFQLVSEELPQPRPAYVLLRGDFQKPGEQVQRQTPAVFPALDAEAPRDRLGLARWLVNGRHPLTARVAVNRYWAQFFGRGIVETIGDFGHLGRFPTHPQLLDWLAVEYVESGWDTKHVLKLMLTSATYRQSSVNDHRHDDIDADNRLLWRAPRFRLPAEEIRDTALRIAGLLNPEVGGPPVFPYQPADYYKGKQGGWTWNVSQEGDQYRRGLYTFWRRTTPYPTFILFDAPDRSECTVSRARTNTPLQALATLNDPQFVEAARVFGQRILTTGPTGADERLTTAFRLAVTREPTAEELDVLRALLAEQLEHYENHPDAAAKLASAGRYARPQDVDVTELAAWSAVANTLLNLDETITRE